MGKLYEIHLLVSAAASGAGRRWRPFSAGLRCHDRRSWTRPTGAQDPKRELRPVRGRAPPARSDPFVNPLSCGELPISRKTLSSGGLSKGGLTAPLWNEIIDYSPPPVPQGYRLYLVSLTGGGERAPVALCREPTEAGAETRGWATPNLGKVAGEKAKSFYLISLLATSAWALATNSATVMAPRSPSFLCRGEMVPLSASLSPTTSM